MDVSGIAGALLNDSVPFKFVPAVLQPAAKAENERGRSTLLRWAS